MKSLVSGFWFLVSGCSLNHGVHGNTVEHEQPETRNQKPETRNQKLPDLYANSSSDLQHSQMPRA